MLTVSVRPLLVDLPSINIPISPAAYILDTRNCAQVYFQFPPQGANDRPVSKVETDRLGQAFLWGGVEFCIINLVEKITDFVICELSLGW